MALGGGGGAAQSPTDRAMAAFAAGIKDPKELQAIAGGMTPMSYENFRQGKVLTDSALPDVAKYGKEMTGLAGGGLMLAGMKQLDAAKNSTASVPGITNRMAARYGLDAAKEHGPDGLLDTSVQDAASRVAANNQARTGLVNAMQGLRFQGIQV